MKHTRRMAITVSAAMILAASALAQSTSPCISHDDGSAGQGPMMGHGMGPAAMLTTQDANSTADMRLVMNLVHSHTKIKRTVTMLPDGIKTVTESDDPKVTQSIQVHVASMAERLKDGKEFNIFSTTLPVIFDNADKIKSVVEMTGKGAIVTRTSSDAKVVTAMRAHAGEVSELIRDGPRGFHRGLNARMAMGSHGPRGAIVPANPAHNH